MTLLIVSGFATSTASALGPYWHVNGSKLVGTRPIKLQLKGVAVLRAETKPTAFTIECGGARSEASTIGGNGTTQGQDKGRLTFSSCKTSLKECIAPETITTNETKSYLALAATQTKIVDVFEPTTGTKYVEFKLTGKCGVIETNVNLAVIGSVAAEVIPVGVEQKEGLLNFPTTAIRLVKHEGTEVVLGMKFANIEAVFGGAFGATLEQGGTFGVTET